MLRIARKNLALSERMVQHGKCAADKIKDQSQCDCVL